LGKEQTVLIEKIRKGVASGYGESYVPVEFPAARHAVNSFVKVRLVGLNDGDDPAFKGEVLQ
jgi:threonylcarbamoyladenosine tRNA methylthiotransferase MtaB